MPRRVVAALSLAGAVVAVLLAACAPFERSYDSNGERIYFTARNDRGERIGYDDGPSFGFMGGRHLSCATCHGFDAKGGTRFVHMTRIDAPDIRWVVLANGEGHGEDGHSGYDIVAFRAAVTAGLHADGEPLSSDMPRWRLTNEDLVDLAAYLQTLR